MINFPKTGVNSLTNHILLIKLDCNGGRTETEVSARKGFEANTKKIINCGYDKTVTAMGLVPVPAAS